VDEDENDHCILHSEVKMGVKEMKCEKAMRDGKVRGDILKLLGEDSLRIMTQLTKNMYETGEWPKDFNEISMIALKKKPKARKLKRTWTRMLFVTDFVQLTQRILYQRGS
jgi:hypothetical protein